MKIKLQNGPILALAGWLSTRPLQGQSSRKRTRFLEILEPVIEKVNEFRLSVVKDHAEVDKEGNYVMIEVEGRTVYDLTPENQEKANAIYEDKLRESSELEVGEDRMNAYNFITKLVFETDYEFKGKEAEFYDSWCTAFENPEASETPQATQTKPETPSQNGTALSV